MNQRPRSGLTLRVAVTFLGLSAVLALAVFQMDLRGYETRVRINQYVLYQNEELACVDAVFTDHDGDYRIACSSQYLLKSGFVEYDLPSALEEAVVTIDDLSDHVTITRLE